MFGNPWRVKISLDSVKKKLTAQCLQACVAAGEWWHGFLNPKVSLRMAGNLLRFAGKYSTKIFPFPKFIKRCQEKRKRKIQLEKESLVSENEWMGKVKAESWRNSLKKNSRSFFHISWTTLDLQIQATRNAENAGLSHLFLAIKISMSYEQQNRLKNILKITFAKCSAFLSVWTCWYRFEEKSGFKNGPNKTWLLTSWVSSNHTAFPIMQMAPEERFWHATSGLKK